MSCLLVNVQLKLNYVLGSYARNLAVLRKDISHSETSLIFIFFFKKKVKYYLRVFYVKNGIFKVITNLLNLNYF